MKKKSHIQIYKSTKNGQFAWRLVAKNGKKIACGGETFHNKKDCLKSIATIASLFLYKTVEINDLTIKIKK